MILINSTFENVGIIADIFFIKERLDIVIVGVASILFFQLVISASTSFSNNYKDPCFSFSGNKMFIHLRGSSERAHGNG